MEQMRVYIANLGKYNEGELVGAWFTPPVDFDEVKERIGLMMIMKNMRFMIMNYPLRLMSIHQLRKLIDCVA